MVFLYELDFVFVCGVSYAYVLGGCLWPSSLFSRALIWMSLRVCLRVLFEKLQIHLRNKQCIIFCFHVLSIHCYLFCMSLWNESNKYAFRLLLLKDGYFSLLLLWVLCVLKRPFLHYFRQYTNIWVLGYVFVCLICGCFLLLHTTTALSSSSFSIIMKKIIFFFCDTFTLFSSFLDCESKNSKRKSSAQFFFCIWVCECVCVKFNV